MIIEDVERLGQSMSWEARKWRKDGTMIWVRETAKGMLIKKQPVLLIVCEDVTDRKRAESLTEHVFDTIPDVASIVGRDYRYRRVNPALNTLSPCPIPLVEGHAHHRISRLNNLAFSARSKQGWDNRRACGDA